MNRSVMEGNPHSVIEGLMIAARAIGANETLVYVRAEYPLAVERMRRAVADAEREGILGKNVFGTGLSMKCEVMEGAGAFVCGEETAMIASIEGLARHAPPKPPFPAQSGLWGKPTIINNVETLAHVSRILNVGPEVFRSIGTKDSPGTKTFALTGHVSNTGLVEVPFGTPLREIVYNIGGGITDDAGKVWKNGFKAVQIGGPSGGCLTEEHLDLPLAYESLRRSGAMVGSGGLVAMNQGTCMVSIARFFMEFTQRESCGKCVLCREGTRQLLALLDDVIEGRADAGTLDLLEKLARAVQVGSLCGLGKTAPNPVLSTLRYFRKEYEEHVFEKRCRTGRCKALLSPEINRSNARAAACASKRAQRAPSPAKRNSRTTSIRNCASSAARAPQPAKFTQSRGYSQMNKVTQPTLTIDGKTVAIEGERNLLELIRKAEHRPAHVLLSLRPQRLWRLPPLPGRGRRARHHGRLLHAAGTGPEGSDHHRRRSARSARSRWSCCWPITTRAAPPARAAPTANCRAWPSGWASRRCASSPCTSPCRSTTPRPRWCATPTSAFCAAIACACAPRFRASAPSTSLIAAMRSAVQPAFGKDLGEVECVNCGQCASVCPTGALTLKSEVDQVWKLLADPQEKSRCPDRAGRARGPGRVLRLQAGRDHHRADRRRAEAAWLRPGLRHLLRRRPDGHRRRHGVPGAQDAGRNIAHVHLLLPRLGEVRGAVLP